MDRNPRPGTSMKRYAVGGAVRDRLLGLPVKEKDWVVVGATPEDMARAGYKPVGKDFPVFLHPQTKEEHALARTERKSGRGYQGFTFHTGPEVTLEDDLKRRDLTVNAIAEADDGAVVDPFGGRRDLEARVLRHVSPAFAEDPVRVLRAARFAARYAGRGFRIADETLALMRRLVADGETGHLQAERVWSETRKALAEPTPSAFLHALRDCGALEALFAEVDALFGVPQRAEFHPEIDTGMHVGMVLDMVARLAPGDALIGWGALTHDLGKALTPADKLPAHPGHEHAGIGSVDALCTRLKVPSDYAALARLCCRLHLLAHTAFQLKPATVLDLFEQLDAFRKPERLRQFLLVCEADKRGRLGLAESKYPQAAYLQTAFAAAVGVGAQQFVDRGLSGPAIGAAMKQARIAAIATIREAAPGER